MLATCATKERLLVDWLEATQAYAAAVHTLNQTAGKRQQKFQALLDLTKNAHLNCEKARKALEDHRKEHGCF
jgi:hypothetical protein